MMFRRVNKQPGIQKFWNLYGHYQDMYDWISSVNKQSGLPLIYSNTAVYGRNELDKSGHLSIFTSLQHLKDLKHLEGLNSTIRLSLCIFSSRKQIWHSFPMKSIHFGVISK